MPSVFGTPSCGVPEAGVSTNRLSPLACRPALLTKRVSTNCPSTDGELDPGKVAETWPCGLIETACALVGMLTPGCTTLPFDVTMRPCASIWNEPSRV